MGKNLLLEKNIRSFDPHSQSHAYADASAAANYGAALIDLVDAHPFLLSDTEARNRLRDRLREDARRRLGDVGAQTAEEEMGIQLGTYASRLLLAQTTGGVR